MKYFGILKYRGLNDKGEYLPILGTEVPLFDPYWSFSFGMKPDFKTSFFTFLMILVHLDSFEAQTGIYQDYYIRLFYRDNGKQGQKR